MPEIHEASIIFTLAKRAAWARDVKFCRERLSELTKLTRGQRETNDWDPLTLIRRAGEHLEAHLANKDAPPDKQVIRMAHLRGVVWPVDRREFELLAYLTDYSWEETLYQHAAKIAASGRVTVLEPEEDDAHGAEGVDQQKDLFQQERAPEVDEGMGLSWEEEADGLQCVVTVNDLGLIKVKGLWFGRDLPQDPEEVVSRFRGILTRLEAPGGTGLNFSNPGEGSQQI